MNKKVLVISSSLRKTSNSDMLAESFANGAREAGNEVEKISLLGKTIGFCTGCMGCAKTAKCVIKDDAFDIEQKMEQADVLVFASPIYYYEMCGQLKQCLTEEIRFILQTINSVMFIFFQPQRKMRKQLRREH